MENNLPYFIHQKQVPDDIFNQLSYIISDQRIPFNQNLAGNLEKEFSLKEYRYILNDFIIHSILEHEFLNIYFKKSNYSSINETIHLDSLWVNYQKKHEFNPVHDHDGLFSFVLFYQIPWLKEEMLDLSPGKNANMNLAGVLEFIYPALEGLSSYHVFADKTYEKQILIFPSNLNHCVYPFYGVDEYRITISGNVTFNNEK